MSDKSNGYEEIAEHFIAARNSRIGPATVKEWSKALPRGIAVLDIGCGHGIPISQALMEEGFAIYGVDASAKLVAAFRRRFPGVPVECSAFEDSEFYSTLTALPSMRPGRIELRELLMAKHEPP